MTPRALAALHHRCFTTTRPWRETEFSDLLASPLVFLASHDHGFALGRTVADETELLTIAVDPDFQNQGIGSNLLQKFEAKSRKNGAQTLFLEVAANNFSAIRLYQKDGYRESARRVAYYTTTSGQKIDAVIMQKISQSSDLRQ